uniref:Uncharacterized protein n=1 Tax=viral metagenome TaxID=1070528 RepID=A0A6C0LUH7_9ZZZZ
MSLSINKLEKMLRNMGILPKKYFTIASMCVYIECLILETADVILVYIPSKYEIHSPSSGSIFKLSPLEVNNDGTIPGEYGEYDDYEENIYEQVNLEIDNNGEKIENQLETGYNQQLSLKDLGGKDLRQLREIFRQLKRLGLCVQSIKYKLCITFKNYLSCIRRDDSFEGFVINGPQSNSQRKIRISIDLESLYTKRTSLASDVKTVRNGIYKVLNKNQIRHTDNIKKILDCKTSFITSSTKLSVKKEKYTKYLSRLNKMLHLLQLSETKEKRNIETVNQSYVSNTGVKGLQMDIEKSHRVSKHNDKIRDINITRQDVIRYTLEIKGELEDLSLHIDKICFDNIVMLDAIARNFNDMSEF